MGQIIMGIGVLDSDFISARDLQIEYFSRTGKEININILLEVAFLKVYFYLSYSNEILKFANGAFESLLDKSNISFNLIHPSGQYIFSYNNNHMGTSPKIINNKDESYYFNPFNLSAKVIYKQKVNKIFKDIDCYNIVLNHDIKFSSFFIARFNEENNNHINFISKYSLLENRFIDDKYTDEEVAELKIKIYNVSIDSISRVANLDSIYFLKSDIDSILKLYDLSINNELIELSERDTTYRETNKELSSTKEENIIQNKKIEPNKDLSSTKEEAYKQIIKGLICLANPNFEYPLKRKKMLKSDNSYNCNAIADKIVSVTEKLRNEGKIINNTRGNTTIRTHINDIIKELNQK